MFSYLLELSILVTASNKQYNQFESLQVELFWADLANGEHVAKGVISLSRLMDNIGGPKSSRRRLLPTTDSGYTILYPSVVNSV